jgi:hypothetical protein
MNFNIQMVTMFLFFVSNKNGLIKSCSSFEDLSVYKISCSHVDWCKFCIHLRSLNVRHFGMVKGTGLKSTASRGHLQWHDTSTEFHKNLPIGSKVISGGHTDRQNRDLIRLTFLFKESRLKMRYKMWLFILFRHLLDIATGNATVARKNCATESSS